MKKALFISILNIAFAVQAFAQAQPRYFVLFKDKAASPFSIDKPEAFLSARSIARRAKQNIAISNSDLPVNPGYLAAVRQIGAKVIFPSKWFNGAVVEASESQLQAIRALAFFKGIELNLPVANINGASSGILRENAVNAKLTTTEDINYGNMNAQLALLGVQELHAKGFHGENMLIALMDNGFMNGQQVGFLKSMRDENRVVDSYDFLSHSSEVFNSGSHGLSVLSTIAAYQPGSLVGAAFKASFALYHTENDFGESPYEEITWLMAAERADSVGADVVNTSLGYSYFDGEFDTPAYNYTYEDMDGKTTIISRAARFATRTGMLLVNAAGNYGAQAWHYITAPADVDSVLTVGSVNYERIYAAHSSVGPNAAGLQKPDVAAVGVGAITGTTSGGVGGGTGTSLASPQIAGLAAILWQAHPTLTAQQIIAVLKKSGHNAAQPDNQIGYGVPNAAKAEEIIAAEYGILGTEKALLSSIVLAPNPVKADITLTIPASLVGKTAAIQLFNTNGKSHYNANQRLTAAHTLPAANLPSGLYLVHIKVDNQERTLKFIKE